MNVAVGILINNRHQLLITRRPEEASHGGKWEFPGGKLEVGELPSTALIREVKEEIGIDVLTSCFLGEIKYTYPMEKQVTLFVFCIEKYRGEPTCCEAQMDLKWVGMDQLAEYEFLEANIQIIELVAKHLAQEHLGVI